MYDDKELKQFDRWGVKRPTHLPHGVTDTYENPLSEQLKRLDTSNWKLEGNELVCDTNQGPLRQCIPPDYVCHGTDENGLPILKKIVI